MEETTQTQPPKQIKVQLDEKTFIYVMDLSSVDIWLTKYPDAKVVSE
jgi:hypothetical protein